VMPWICVPGGSSVIELLMSRFGLWISTHISEEANVAHSREPPDPRIQ
jgi:hypothetical protein